MEVLFVIHILIVEDNDSLRKLMRLHLERAGYQVSEAADGVQALQIIEHNHIHLLIADVMMPLLGGFELTGELRNAKYTIPILIVSAKDTLEDKRQGFQRGADDYLTKPFDMDEMLLRVEALLRRARISESRVLTIGACRLERDSMLVTCRDREYDLRQKEFLLLYKLLSYPGTIFTRQALMDEIWGYDSETDPRTVDTHIKRLREKLAEIPEFEIVTIRGLGYKAVIRV